MLLSFDFLGTDFIAAKGDLTAGSEASLLTAEGDMPIAGFAELLQKPVLIADPTLTLETGELLPEGGNLLPTDLAETLKVTPQVGQRAILLDGIPSEVLAGALPAFGPVVAKDSLLQTGSAISKPTPAAVPAPAQPLSLLQLNGVRPKDAFLSADAVEREIQPLQVKPAAAESLRDAFRNISPRSILSGRRAPVTNDLQLNGNNARPITALDTEAINRLKAPLSGSGAAGLAELSEKLTRPVAPKVAPGAGKPTPWADKDIGLAIRAQVGGTSPDQFAAAMERMQLSAPGQSASTTLPTIAAASPLTSGSPTLFAPPPLAATPLLAPINIPVQDAAWGNALNSRVLFMTGQSIHNAEIRLNPAELGPITIKVAMGDGAADVTFVAQHALTREAIELALPRLRELLSENGLLLGNTSVSEEGVEKEGGGQDTKEARESSDQADEVMAEEEVAMADPARLSQGLVDTFV